MKTKQGTSKRAHTAYVSIERTCNCSAAIIAFLFEFIFVQIFSTWMFSFEVLTTVCIQFRSTDFGFDVVQFYRWLNRAFRRNVLWPSSLSPTYFSHSLISSFGENVVYLRKEVFIFIFAMYSSASRSEFRKVELNFYYPCMPSWNAQGQLHFYHISNGT
jgi:hypothetical protein